MLHGILINDFLPWKPKQKHHLNANIFWSMEEFNMCRFTSSIDVDPSNENVDLSQENANVLDNDENIFSIWKEHGQLQNLCSDFGKNVWSII